MFYIKSKKMTEVCHFMLNFIKKGHLAMLLIISTSFLNIFNFLLNKEISSRMLNHQTSSFKVIFLFCKEKVKYSLLMNASYLFDDLLIFISLLITNLVFL